MRFLRSLAPAFVLFAAGAANAASWSFDNGKVVVSPKKGGAESIQETLSENSALSRPINLGHAEMLKVSLTAKEGSKGKRPHQAFLIVTEADTGLEVPFPLAVKDSGKGIVEISQKDLPVQLLQSTKPLHASIIIGSFGTAKGLSTKLFDIDVKPDPNSAPLHVETPVRYGKQPEIHHIFRSDPKSPPKIISLAFVLAVAATVPALLIAQGANISDLSGALAAAPLSHLGFFGSIVAMEFVFFMYYSSWNLFTALPVIGVVGTVLFLSGSKALGEVQSRRLAGQR